MKMKRQCIVEWGIVRVERVKVVEVAEDVDAEREHLLDVPHAEEEGAGEGEGGEEEERGERGGLVEGDELGRGAAAEPGGLEGGVGVEAEDGVEERGGDVGLDGVHGGEVGVDDEDVVVEEVEVGLRQRGVRRGGGVARGDVQHEGGEAELAGAQGGAEVVVELVLELDGLVEEGGVEGGGGDEDELRGAEGVDGVGEIQWKRR